MINKVRARQNAAGCRYILVAQVVLPPQLPGSEGARAAYRAHVIHQFLVFPGEAFGRGLGRGADLQRPALGRKYGTWRGAGPGCRCAAQPLRK